MESSNKSPGPSRRALEAADLSLEMQRMRQQPQFSHAVVEQWLWDQFRNQSGIDATADKADHLEAFGRWLNFQAMESDLFTQLAFDSPRTIRGRLYATYNGKINVVNQRHCNICSVHAPLYPVHTFGISITPLSRQAANPAVFRAYKAAIKSWWSFESLRDLGSTGRYCVALTFVLKSSSRDKDLDNMAKALLDGLADALAIDDRHIHHLDLVKLIFADADEYVGVRMAPSAINEHAEVVAPLFERGGHPTPPLDLADFIEPRKPGLRRLIRGAKKR